MEFKSSTRLPDRYLDQTQKKEKRRPPHFFSFNSSQAKETSSVLPNALDKGKELASPDKKEREARAIGEDGKPIPKTVNLSTESTPRNPRMLGGMKGESSRESDEFREWLKSKDGYHWLDSPDGWNWLKSQDGRDWLDSLDSRRWLDSPDGRNWLKSDGGRNWLDSPYSRRWLDSPDGWNWLKIEDGRDWLDSPDGWNWLAEFYGGGWNWLKSEDGYKWLDSDAGIRWLNGDRSNYWLNDHSSLEWRCSRDNDNCRWLMHTKGRCYLVD